MCNFKYGDIVKVDDGSHDGFFDGKIGYFIRIDAQNPKKAEIVFLGEDLLHCDEQYFAHPNIHNDFLDRVFDKEKDSNTSMKVKIKIRDFLSDFMFVNEVLSDEQKKNFICEK